MPDVRRLGWSRVAIGTLILLRTTPLLAWIELPFLRSACPLLGWPDGRWTVASLPTTIVALLCIVRTTADACFTIGYRVRATGLLCGLSGLLILIDDPFQFVFTVVQLYLSAIVLSLTDAGGAVSLFRAPIRAPESSRWLIRVLLASIYCWLGCTSSVRTGSMVVRSKLVALAFHGVLQLIASPDLLGFGMCALLLGCWEPHPANRIGKSGRGTVWLRCFI